MSVSAPVATDVAAFRAKPSPTSGRRSQRRDALAALSRVCAPVLAVHADAPWTVAADINAPWAETPYIDHATVKAQVAAAREARLYVSPGQHHSGLIQRPSAGAIEAVRSFAREIRARGGATAVSMSTARAQTQR
jgi:hypothetical protein